MADAMDPYPFILLNLVLSCIAAIQAPIIMMSQNREAKRESLKSTNDFKTNIKSELILEKLYDKMEEILRKQNKILEYIDNNNINIDISKEEKSDNNIEEVDVEEEKSDN